ncbi:hypothetical protein [Psychrobacillus sp. BM2]|uniref:hypothetical protein n=1 Tax=Psychrobacillus sp. BM2 TaxID=3400421 RepID=UPI003B0196E9
MKRKMVALPLALSSLLILGACGDDDTDVDEIEVNDPLLEDDGENDTGIENEANDEEEKIEEVEENEDAETQEEGSINDSTDDAND